MKDFQTHKADKLSPGLPNVYQVYPRNPLSLNGFRGFFFAPFWGSVYHGSTRETF